MGEVGMAVQKIIQTRVVGIIRYMLHPYCFSSNGISVKSSRDVRRFGHFCTPLVETHTIVLKDVLRLVR